MGGAGLSGRRWHRWPGPPLEFKDPSRIDEVGRDLIIEAAPVVSGPRPADRNIAANAAEDNGVYQPSQHLERVRDSFERQGKDPEAFVRSHVRRLEALRRAGHVERIDADNWKVPKNIVERGQAFDLSQGGDGLRIRTLSAISLEKQVGSDGATWLDRQIIAGDRSEIRDSGFGRELTKPSAVGLGDSWRWALRSPRMATSASPSIPWRLLSDRRSSVSARRWLETAA